jgi:hypothetical protein
MASNPIKPPKVLELIPLILTGIDAMIMDAYDPSIPINPGRYNSQRHFQDRINLEDARSVGIANTWESFEENRRQLVALAHLPREAFLYSIRFQKLKKELGRGKGLPKWYVKGHPPESITSKLSISLLECINGKRKFPSLSKRDLASYHHVAGVAHLGSPDWIGPSIKAFAVSILFQCWQVYEVLTVDLATDAISNNPSKFPNSKLPIEIFRGPAGKKNGIRDTYTRLFGASATGIAKALADEHLDYTFAIRNLFAHKAGKTDKKYRDLVKPLSLAKIIRPEEGDEFPLTGELVGALGNNCFSMGYYLLREVYLWLKR